MPRKLDCPRPPVLTMLCGVDMHHGQLEIPIHAVRSLVDEQFPSWSGMPIKRVASHGTVNALFRIGEHLVARFPVQGDDVKATRQWLEREANAARELLGRTPFPTPEPVAVGEPGARPASLVSADLAAGNGRYAGRPWSVRRVRP